MNQDNSLDNSASTNEPLEEYGLRINLSAEAKSKIRQKWTTSLTIKVYERTIGFNYLKWKIQNRWNPKGQMDVIDLGDGYFITKFTLEEDIQDILRGGLWFIANHYLTIRRWTPNFLTK